MYFDDFAPDDITNFDFSFEGMGGGNADTGEVDLAQQKPELVHDVRREVEENLSPDEVFSQLTKRAIRILKEINDLDAKLALHEINIKMESGFSSPENVAKEALKQLVGAISEEELRQMQQKFDSASR